MSYMEHVPKNEHIEPYDELIALARKKLLELFPDLSKKLNSRTSGNVAHGFVLDALDQNGMAGAFVFHNLSPEKQKQALEEKNIDVKTLFDNLPENLIVFYRNKIEKPTKNVDVFKIAKDM